MVEKVNNKTLSQGSFYSDRLYEDPSDFHEYCRKFPRMKSDRIIDLSKSVLEFGQLEDIILLNGQILDGRHLYWACKTAGVTPRFRNYDSNLHPWVYVKIKNLHRRDLTTAQRAALALEDLKTEREIAKERKIQSYFKIKNMQQEKNEKNTVSDPGSPTVSDDKKGKAVEIVAKEWKIAPKSLRKAEKISKIAEKNPFIKAYWERSQEEDVPLEKIDRNIKKALRMHKPKKNQSYKDFIKLLELVETSKDDPVIQDLIQQVKDGKISANEAIQKIEEILSLKKSMRSQNTKVFYEKGTNYKKKLYSKKEKEKIISNRVAEVSQLGDRHDSLDRKNVCKFCPKATVMAIECECENCGHLNLTPKVVCDDDFTNGSRKLREPDSELCKNSPDYDLLIKN